MSTKTTTKSKDVVKHAPAPPVADERAAIKQMLDDIEKMWFHVSVRLYEIKAAEKFKDWGFVTFQEYVESELGMEPRKADYRVQAGASIVKFHLTEDQIDGIGWTKFKEVASYLSVDSTKADVTEILKKAKTLPQRELAEFVRTEKIKRVGGTVSPKTNLSFLLTSDQKGPIDQALALAGSEAGIESLAEQLLYVCLHYLDTNDSANMAEIKEMANKLSASAAEKVKAPYQKRAVPAKKAAEKKKAAPKKKK